MSGQRSYVCLPGAWMGAWSWQFVLERLRAAGHDARALPFRGVGERAAELSPACDNDLFLDDTLDTLAKDDMRDIVLVGHSFGSLIAQLVVDRVPDRIAPDQSRAPRAALSGVAFQPPLPSILHL